MTISPAQYRENWQLRHKWVLSPAGLSDEISGRKTRISWKWLHFKPFRLVTGGKASLYICVVRDVLERGKGIGRDSVGF
jgi:hypothetical protein